MKRILVFLIAVIPLLTACASSNNVINDEAYYSPYDSKTKNEKILATSNYGYFDSSTVKETKKTTDADYETMDTITTVVDTVYVVDSRPTTTVAVGFGVGFYAWDPSGTHSGIHIMDLIGVGAPIHIGVIQLFVAAASHTIHTSLIPEASYITIADEAR